MQPDYNELVRRQQQSYQQSRDPFEYGQQVAKRRYSEIISGIDSQASAAQKSYGDLYQEAMKRSTKSQAAGMPTLSGGMGQQAKDYVSALESEQLSQIGQARQQAEQDLFTQRQSAFANAQLEGQQATQMELQTQQTRLDLVRQKQQILADDTLTQEQKNEQLNILGYKPEDVVKEVPAGVSPAFQAVGGILGAVGLGTALIKGITGAGLLKAAGFVATKLVPWAAVVTMAAYGIERGIEFVQGKGTEGGIIGQEGFFKTDFNI